MLRFVWQDGSERKVRLYLCSGCRHVQHLFFDPASIAAVEVAERFADGQASEEDLRKAAWFAESPTFGYDFEERFLNQFPGREGVLACLIEKGAVPEAVLHGGEWRVDEAGKSRLIAAASLAEFCAIPSFGSDWGFQFVPEVDWPGRWLIDCVFGNPFRLFSPDPWWLTADVIALAQAAYAERILPDGHLEPQRLAVLADALEEAGCADRAILDHLRGEGPHVRGCWVIDLALGKE
jgi:hypothetical protein